MGSLCLGLNVYPRFMYWKLSPQGKSVGRLDPLGVIMSWGEWIDGLSWGKVVIHKNGFVRWSVGHTLLLSCCYVPPAMLGHGKQALPDSPSLGCPFSPEHGKRQVIWGWNVALFPKT